MKLVEEEKNEEPWNLLLLLSNNKRKKRCCVLLLIMRRRTRNHHHDEQARRRARNPPSASAYAASWQSQAVTLTTIPQICMACLRKIKILWACVCGKPKRLDLPLSFFISSDKINSVRLVMTWKVEWLFSDSVRRGGQTTVVVHMTECSPSGFPLESQRYGTRRI